MHYGNLGIDLTGGSGRVLSELSAANDPNTLMNKLRRKGVMIRKIIFFGFLNVRIKFFLIRSPDWLKNPRGWTAEL